MASVCSNLVAVVQRLFSVVLNAKAAEMATRNVNPIMILRVMFLCFKKLINNAYSLHRFSASPDFIAIKISCSFI